MNWPETSIWPGKPPSVKYDPAATSGPGTGDDDDDGGGGGDDVDGGGDGDDDDDVVGGGKDDDDVSGDEYLGHCRIKQE